MKPLRTYWKKFALASLCIMMVLSSAYVPIGPNRNEAHAQWIVFDPTIFSEKLVKQALDALQWMIAKTIIQSMTSSIVNWINSGFEGSPAFVSDLSENLGNLADTIAEDFLDTLDRTAIASTGFSIRSPFQDQLAAQLREEFYRTTSSYGFDARHPYTLGRYSSDPEAFRKGDFKKGGWNAHFAQSQNLANNPYSRYMLARNELWSRIDEAEQNRLREIADGRGFMSWRGNCGPHGRLEKSNRSGGTGAPKDGSAPVSLQKADATVGCRIRTPGALIEQSLGITLNSPLRQLELADSFDEIVGALMTQMVNQVFGGGGLSGLSQPRSGGGRSYLNQATSGSSNLGDGFSSSIVDLQVKVKRYQADWERIASAASNAKSACARDATKSQEADRVLQLANQRSAEAASILTELAALQSRKDTVQKTESSDNSMVVKVVSDYQALLSRTGPLAEGQRESADTGDAKPGSLYSQMTRLAASCR